MSDGAFLLAAGLYALAGALLAARLVRGGDSPWLAWGARLLGLAGVVHLGHDLLDWIAHHRGPLSGVRESISTLGLLAVAGYFAVRRSRQRFDVVGAFVAPLALLMLLASHNPGGAPTQVAGALLAVHIGAVILGTGAFTVAFALALAYLLQERQVKRKRLGGVFQRLPPLDSLDEAGFRCVAAGLPVLTLGVVTGLLVGARGDARVGLLASWQQVLGIGVWALFAALLALRLGAGWRGRRAALGTLVGYGSALVVLLGYYLRGGAS